MDNKKSETLHDMILGLDKKTMADFLYFIYNLGIRDGYADDRSSMFNEELMDRSGDKLTEFVNLITTTKDIYPDSDE